MPDPRAARRVPRLVGDRLLFVRTPARWRGARARDQAEVDAALPALLAAPARRRFLDLRGIRGPVDLLPWLDPTGACCGGEPEYRCPDCPASAPWRHSDPDGFDPTLSWVILGGTSGRAATPLHPEWAREVRDQCEEHGVPFFFAGWGDWVPISELAEADWQVFYRPNVVAEPGQDQGILDEAYGRTCTIPWGAIGYRGAFGVDDGPGSALWAQDARNPFWTDGEHQVGYQVFRMGREAAPRTLDGVLHQDIPEFGGPD